MKKIFLVLFLMCLVFANPVQATPVEFTFSGYLTQVNDPNNLFTGIDASTSTFTGTVSYDTSSAGSGGIYPADSYSIIIDGSYSFTSISPLISIINDTPGFDRFIAVTQSGSDVSSSVETDYMFLALTDGTSNLYSDRSLPEDVLLSDFNGWNGIIISNDSSQGLGDTDSAFIISGLINSLESTPVPEPTTMLLLGIGLVGLAGVSRKKFIKN